ncbi:MAG TPA: DNA polymerase I [Nitrospiria bacterium]|nr:DNA polymerase I [Nitrospiria bacterium]
MESEKTFYIIDGSSYIYRAYHAIRDLSTSKGFPTNAIYGFAQMLLKIVKEKRPDYLAIAFDTAAPTFRHTSYADYKANRPEMPNPLAVQIPYIHRLVEAFNIPVVMADGYEADDLIGTLARKGEAAGFSVVIVTGDKDMLQLVSPAVSAYDSMKDKRFREAEVRDRFGVEPSRVVEVMGLMGDDIDNIPGVPGIGPKTATELIRTFGTIEHLLAEPEKIKKKSVREALVAHAEEARLSKDLATIRTDCPIEFEPERFRAVPPDPAALVALCQELEFSSLLKQIAPALPQMKTDFAIVDDPAKAEQWLAACGHVAEIAVESVLSEEDPMRGALIGLAIAAPHPNPLPGGEGRGEGVRVAYVPDENTDALQAFRPLLESEKVAKIGHDLKRTWVALRARGIHLRGIRFDLEVAAYLINPSRPDLTLESMALEWMGIRLASADELMIGLTGDKGGRLASLRPEQIAPWSCERAGLLPSLRKKLQEELSERGVSELFDRVEIPLVEVLAEMEQVGFKVDPAILGEISKELEGKLAEETERIYQLAKGEFNINSPKQLAEVLFERLGLPPVRKTKTGYSTDEEVLTQLALQHPLPAEILSYRQQMKLKSTYVDALPRMIHPKTGRLHTQFTQTVTATGRLSSREPNLQNIPVRGEIGRRIRQAFVAQEGSLLLSADYNQIELRILAHLSGDPSLIESFSSDEDIHARTASEIFGLPKGLITAEMRRVAKTVNFGILYGMSPFGLASSLGVSQMEAKRYIDRYFSTYAGVKRFIEETLERVRSQGYVTTLFNRRRYIPELTSPNAALRAQGERLAINTPIQGSAADLIKIAMIRVHRSLKEDGFQEVRMLLQVHDELIFELPEGLIGPVRERVRADMEGVASLRVPLSVGMKVGKNWGEIE